MSKLANCNLDHSCKFLKNDDDSIIEENREATLCYSSVMANIDVKGDQEINIVRVEVGINDINLVGQI